MVSFNSFHERDPQDQDNQQRWYSAPASAFAWNDNCIEVRVVPTRVGERASIEGVRCSPHTFRHTFAKNFLMNGGDLFTLQKILGHSSLSVVRMYVELTPEDVQIQYRQYSPMDCLKTQAQSPTQKGKRRLR